MRVTSTTPLILAISTTSCPAWVAVSIPSRVTPLFALAESALSELPVVPPLPPLRVLFLCTANSARSQLAEGLLRHIVAVSWMSQAPALRARRCIPVRCGCWELGIACSHQQATHVDALRDHQFDYIITLCDRMREVCPVFPGQPDTIHWSLPNPVQADASDAEQYLVFRQTAEELTRRLRYLLVRMSQERR